MLIHVIHRRLCRLALLLVLLLVSHHGNAKELVATVVGEAFALGGDKPLYSELHCVSKNGLGREVFYRDAKHQLIAHKTLTYNTGPLTPSFVQENFYSKEVVTVELRKDELSMTVRNGEDTVSESIVLVASDASMPLVIDAGFDAFVTQHWDSLVAGESRRFEFPFAARESLVNLRIEASSCSYGGDTDQCFTLEIDNFFLAMLVSPIELGYNVNLRRLARFRGLSNIGDAEGGGQAVDIRYRYQDVSELACNLDAMALDETSPHPLLSHYTGRS